MGLRAATRWQAIAVGIAVATLTRGALEGDWGVVATGAAMAVAALGWLLVAQRRRRAVLDPSVVRALGRRRPPPPG